MTQMGTAAASLSLSMTGTTSYFEIVIGRVPFLTIFAEKVEVYIQGNYSDHDMVDYSAAGLTTVLGIDITRVDGGLSTVGADAVGLEDFELRTGAGAAADYFIKVVGLRPVA